LTYKTEEHLKVIGMFQHVAHYNKNMEKMMLEMLTFKLQQKHEVEKFELIEKCQYVIQDI
jgi:hypothetical protein